MRAAATEIGTHMFADLRVGRSAVCGQQRVRAHDHAGNAIAALCRLLLDESALQRARRLLAAQPLERGDLAPLQDRDRRETREDGLAVNDDRAGAALSQPAAEFRAVEL